MSLPITATYAPLPPFFRRPRTLRRWSSSTASTATTITTSDDDDDDLDNTDDDDDDSQSSSSSGSSGAGPGDLLDGTEYRHRPRFTSSNASVARSIALSLSSAASISSRPGSSTARTVPGASQTPQTKAQLRLSLALLRTRQALASQSYDQLTTSLKSLASVLPSNGAASGATSLGVFVPILERLSRDLEAQLSGQDKGRNYRKTLTKEDAKALVALRQRWAISGQGGNSTTSDSVSNDSRDKGKGKQKDTEQDWVSQARALVEQNPPPSFIARPHDTATHALLSSLESLLLPSALPRLSLAGLGLSTRELSNLQVLSRAQRVLEWYLSFSRNLATGSTAIPSRTKARAILFGVRSLDLSKNQLDAFPSFLPRLLPGLETLNLSNNKFRHLPPSITLFSAMRRLKTHGNYLARRGRSKAPRRQQNSLVDRREGRSDEAISPSRLVFDDGLNHSGDATTPTKSNTGQVADLVEIKLRERAHRSTAGTRDSRQRLQRKSRVRSLASLCIEMLRLEMQLQDQSRQSQQGDPGLESSPEEYKEGIDADSHLDSPPLSELPLHLSRALAESYYCASCHRFVTAPLSTPPASAVHITGPSPEQQDGLDWLPALFERVHHLDPGVALPAPVVHHPSSTRIPPPFPTLSSTLAQPVQGTSANPAQSSLSIAAAAASLTGPTSHRPVPHPHSPLTTTTTTSCSLQLEDRVLLALYARSTAELQTLVIGADDWRFCVPCAASHLRVRVDNDDEDEDGERQVGDRLNRRERERGPEVQVRTRCQCPVCREERRVKSETTSPLDSRARARNRDHTLVRLRGEQLGSGHGLEGEDVQDGDGDGDGDEFAGREQVGVMRWLRRRVTPRIGLPYTQGQGQGLGVGSGPGA